MVGHLSLSRSSDELLFADPPGTASRKDREDFTGLIFFWFWGRRDSRRSRSLSPRPSSMAFLSAAGFFGARIVT